MTTTPDPALAAGADQRVAGVLDMFRSLAASPEIAARGQHDAAHHLSQMLAETFDAATLATVLANDLISEVRREPLPPPVVAVGLMPGLPSDTTEKALDPDVAGVEVRLIGPELAVRRLAARIDAGGAPLVGFRGPADADDRPNTVRLYAYTDRETVRAQRRIQRARSRARRDGGTR